MATARMEQARDARNFQRATRVSVHWKLHTLTALRSLTAFRSDVRSGNPPRVAWLMRRHAAKAAKHCSSQGARGATPRRLAALRQSGPATGERARRPMANHRNSYISFAEVMETSCKRTATPSALPRGFSSRPRADSWRLLCNVLVLTGKHTCMPAVPKPLTVACSCRASCPGPKGRDSRVSWQGLQTA